MEPHIQKYGEINYKTKLLGIAPRLCNFDMSSPWETKNIKVCKKPSQHTGGTLVVSDEATLIETGIVEKRIDFSGEFDASLPIPSDENSVNDFHSHDEHSDQTESISSTIEKRDAAECSSMSLVHGSESLFGCIGNSTDSKVESSENGGVNEPPREKASTKFVTKCFNHLKTSTPDFLSDRRLLCHVAVEDSPYVIKARKCLFTSDDDDHKLEVIELAFLNSPNSNSNIGVHFAKWTTKDEDTMSQSLKKMSVSDESKLLDEDQNKNLNETLTEEPYHHAFIEGELSKNGFNKIKKFTIIMSAQINGVWKREDNPMDYTCNHLAEVKTANVKTIESHVFYKNVRMRQNWFKAHLAGKKNYMVGINKRDSDRTIIQELILYDVEKVPGAILSAAKEHKFEPWTPDNLHQRLFIALEFIYDTMKNSKIDEEFVFIHYEKSDHLFYDQDESLLKEYVKRKCTLTIRYLPKSESDSTWIENTMAQLRIIMKCVGYSPNQPFPEFEKDNHGVKLTFTEPKLAESFSFKVSLYWKLKVNIPKGFEQMLILQPKVQEPRPLKGKYVRIESRVSKVSSDKVHQQYNHESRYYDPKRNWRK